jgi:N-acetylglutamate synthase-like GNAT family acetyltransferase
MISKNKAIISSNRSMWDYCDRLEQDNLRHLIKTVIKKRISSLNNPDELDKLLQDEHIKQYLTSSDLLEVLQAADAMIKPNDSRAYSLARSLIQAASKMQNEVVFTNAAHAYALWAVRMKSPKLMAVMEEMTRHGFPSLENQFYIDDIVNGILKASLTTATKNSIIEAFSRSGAEKYFQSLGTALCSNAEKHRELWSLYINAVTVAHNRDLGDILVEVFISTKQTEKTLTKLYRLVAVQTTEVSRVYWEIANKALEFSDKQKGHSGFKFFGGQKK